MEAADQSAKAAVNASLATAGSRAADCVGHRRPEAHELARLRLLDDGLHRGACPTPLTDRPLG
ncbi:hypothetical protein OG590_34655 [Streptomyces goshikiensis]|uniref:hypothetical protein n=1 Tax=Streptomyces goshikiensis TaxID=1942 RepID=UPI00386416C3|nr:hypothetical protein OG590_34655 [Streptomyces goshikiensis]